MTGIQARFFHIKWLGVAVSLSLSVAAAANAESTFIHANTEYSLARALVYDSGAVVEAPLIVQGMDTCRNVNAILAQRSYKLAAVLDEQVARDCAATGKTADRAISSLTFGFTVPEVKRVTSFVWEFVGCRADQSCETLGELEFSALPQDFLQPVVTWSNEHAIYLDDSNGALAAFLDAYGIEYVESSRAIAQDDEVVSLVVRTDPDSKTSIGNLPGNQYKRVITFFDYATDIPLIWVESGAASVSIEVRTPIVHEMSNDAANKKLFCELFQKLF